jgi:hypothetical protein
LSTAGQPQITLKPVPQQEESEDDLE